MKQEEFEQKVMDMLLDGDDSFLKTLRNQFLNSKVISRVFTYVGFFTDYQINENIPPVLNGKDFHFGDVIAYCENDEWPLDFLIHGNNGYLSQLEGVAFGDAWPEDYSKVTLKYDTPDGKRNLPELRAMWFRDNK